MEFEHVGVHCELETCNQKDFLPFKCDACKKTLCLAHRSYVAHNCEGANAKDITSVDCPVCGKGIKMSKADNPDTIWEAHYLNDCSQQPGVKASPGKCSAPNCRVTLGPSNTFQCPKCHKKVCLSHRIPEEHSCSGLSFGKEKFISNLEKQKKDNSTPKFSAAQSKITSTAKKSVPPAKSVANSIYDTVDRRKKPQTNSISPPSSTFPCPLCNSTYPDEESLLTHISFEHEESTASNSGPPNRVTTTASVGPSSGREVCPHCQQRFTDVVALVSHVEAAHSNNNSRRQSGSSRSQCSLS